ncbi:MAG: amylo-alpha-1,6-glucosidase, partial [Mycetocola sp.]
YRMPELHSGDPAGVFSRPIPYPAACRPQAWSAAAAVAVLGASLGVEPAGDTLSVRPGALGSPVAVRGLRFGGVDVSVDEHGVVSDAALVG